MWRDQLGCCDGSLQLGSAGSCGGISWASVMVVCDWAAAGSCGGISWAAVMVVCDWAQLVHVEGSVGLL